MEGTHFLIVTYPAQGHVNPAIHLAYRLANTTGARITFSTAVSGHRKMFSDLASPDQEVDDGPISYIPFTDGYDEGFKHRVDDVNKYVSQFKAVGSQSLSSVIDKLNARGQRIDCVIYTFMVSWVTEVAHDHGIPSAQYWIQPAIVFSIYYSFFHGYDALVSASNKDSSSMVILPGLQPLQVRDLPTFLTTSTSSTGPYAAIFNIVKEAYLALDREKTKHKRKVLVNTFDELEADALSAIDDLDLIAVGPILQSGNTRSFAFDLFKYDEKEYIRWLDSKPKKSVVYVSFGSLVVLEQKQIEEVLKGLKASGKPYLCVIRKDCRYEGIEIEEKGENAMVIEWCSQVGVLSHPAVGCFVTHCGWNSTLESLVCGVPTVAAPQWGDQRTNAMLLEKTWGTGVRSEVNEEGILVGDELQRCLDLILGEGERGVEIRRKAESWKEKAAEAIADGGSSDHNLREFVNEIASYNQIYH